MLQELADALSKHGISTFEVPFETILDRNEIKDHPTWYNVRCLISTRNRLFLEELFHKTINNEGGGDDRNDGKSRDDSESCLNDLKFVDFIEDRGDDDEDEGIFSTTLGV